MIRSALLLLGGNIGDMEQSLGKALSLLEQRGCEIIARSGLYTTPAWGFNCSDEFTNQGVEITTSLEAEELLDITQSIEAEIGRDRAEELTYKEQSGERYAPRVIDIDIILFGDERVSSERLTIPHPQMAQREFVLRPLSEIAPRRVHPISGKSIEEMLHEVIKMPVK